MIKKNVERLIVVQGSVLDFFDIYTNMAVAYRSKYKERFRAAFASIVTEEKLVFQISEWEDISGEKVDPEPAEPTETEPPPAIEDGRTEDPQRG